MSMFSRSRMPIASSRLLALALAVAAAVAVTALAGCSSTPSRFKSRQNLTGGTETMRATPPPSFTEPAATGRRGDDPHGNAVYRGGRDPVTGKAPGPAATEPPTLPKPRADLRTGQRPQVAGRTVVEVVEGDTLYGLSTKYRVSMNSIMAANGLKDPALTPGQQLLIPVR